MNTNLTTKRNKYLRYFLLIMLFCQYAELQMIFAQEDAKAVLKNIQDKYSSINNLSADLVQTVNQKVNLKGKVFYKKEDNLRYEFDNVIIISDGKSSWNYNKKQNKVIITDYESEGNKILSIRHLIYDYPNECELSTYISEGKKILELIPQTDTFSFNSIKLTIDSDYLISKVLVDDPATGIIQLNLTNYQLNKSLPDSQFQFTPPEGSQVLDLR